MAATHLWRILNPSLGLRMRNYPAADLVKDRLYEPESISFDIDDMREAIYPPTCTDISRFPRRDIREKLGKSNG